MPRYLVRSLAFCALLAAQLAVVETFMHVRYRENNAMKFLETLDRTSAHDTVVLGTSSTLLAVNPLLLGPEGRQVYNLAFAGAGPAYYQRWYPLFRRHHPRPKLVVWGVDWFAFDRRYLKRRLEHDSQYLPLGEVATMLVDPTVSQRELLLNRFALVNKRKALLDPAYDRRLTQQTYFKGNTTFPAVGRLLPAAVPTGALDAEAVAAFKAVVAAMQADGVRVVMFQPPHLLTVTGARTAERERVAAIASELGVKWLDYDGDRRSALNEDESLFNDWAHLNEFGTWAFSRRFRADLQAEGLL